MPNTNESEEMYLETILRLEESGQESDLTNIARVMKVTKPAIIKARQKLCDLGFAWHDTHNIYLTPLGREIAERVYEKHKLFTRLLRRMGVSNRAYRFGRNGRVCQTIHGEQRLAKNAEE